VAGSLSARFDRLPDDGERARFAAGLSSNGARLASWKAHPASGRTYALVDYDRDVPPLDEIARLQPSARIDDPPLCVLDIEPAARAACARIAAVLGGPGGPAGVREALVCGNSVLVEFDERRTSLALVVDLIDLELAHEGPGRSIVPLLGLRDDTLAAFSAAVLATPEIDSSRLVETYTDPLLVGPGSPQCS
jgi:hypothetical protein